MNVLNAWFERRISLGLVMCLVVPVGMAEMNPLQQQSSSTSSAVTGPDTQEQPSNSPNHVTPTSDPVSSGDKPASASTGIQDQQAPSQTRQPLPSPTAQTTQQETPPPPPAGTAAAPYEKQQGVSGSRPSGAAIAPGKQRRIRSFAIRVGLLVGAAIAIGVVAGASLASPSRP